MQPMILTKEELQNITGGGDITASMLTSIVRLGTFLLDFGRAIGSAIRRSSSGSQCSF